MANAAPGKDEEFVACHLVFADTSVASRIAVAEALGAPDADHWIEGMCLEKTKLEAYKSWRVMEKDEAKKFLDAGGKALPLVILLSRKRCGRYKARAVVLGNRWSNDGDAPTYSPVVSSAANRFVWAYSISEGHHVEMFDIENAFLHAHLDEEFGEVVIKLPEIWRDQNKSAYAKLLKAVYGLPIAPLAWYRKYHKTLTKLGWIRGDEPGLYKKRSWDGSSWVLLTVYVDDNVISAKCKQEMQSEMQKILNIHKGTIVPAVNYTRDVLGADYYYNREERVLKVTMSKYIVKLAKRFHMTGCRSVHSPSFDEEEILRDESIVEFPLKELLGCLQWAAITCRPDICQPVNALSRFAGGGVVKKKMVDAAKKVLRYLITTQDVGLVWSDQHHADFQKTYSELRGTALSDFTNFSDASFASRSVEFKSISGTIMYFRGFPIIWKSSKQTLRAMSTAEAEYIAASDALTVEESLGFMNFLGDGLDPPLFVDNKSAIAIAKSPDTTKKSRHFMLRYCKVRDNARRLFFCPTTLQKADALTKSVPLDVRMSLFHTTCCCVWIEEE